jgi:hypothetical protein
MCVGGTPFPVFAKEDGVASVMPSAPAGSLLASLDRQQAGDLRVTLREYVAAVLAVTGGSARVDERPYDRRDLLSQWLAPGVDMGYPLAEMMLDIHGPEYTWVLTRSIRGLDCATDRFTADGDAIIAHCMATADVNTGTDDNRWFMYVGGVNVDVTVKQIDGELKVTATEAHPTNPQ